MFHEELLHFIWKHRFLPLGELKTLTDTPLEVLDPGLPNTDAGPDFLHSKIKIGHTVWVGNVEIHLKAQDWYLHGHDKNPAYDTVILHVSLQGGCPVRNSQGELIPQLVLSVPSYMEERYSLLKAGKEFLPCRPAILSMNTLQKHGWMERLLVERLEERNKRIYGYFVETGYSWENAFFITLSRAFGFGKNSYTFELWARQLPYSYLHKHIGNLQELEALFLGTAGLLQDAYAPHFKDVYAEKEFQHWKDLQQEYAYLKHKYELRQTDASLWKYLRTRPHNFPHIRLLQLAALYQFFCYKVTSILDGTLDFRKALNEVSESQKLRLTARSMQLLELNTSIPLIYALGKYRGEENHMQLAVDKLSSLPPEDNQIIRSWIENGMEVQSAADSQALLQLQRNYCDKKDCLRCRFGMEYLRCK